MSISFLGKPHIKTQQAARWRSTIQPREQPHYKDNSNGNFSVGPVAKMFTMRMWDALICCTPTALLLLLTSLHHGQRYISEPTQPPLLNHTFFSSDLLTVLNAVGLLTPKKIHSDTHEPVLLQVGCTVYLPP